ncbi:SDR family oxidoreductase [Nocardia vinacea]|uniref:SDR family oxidoreductase n=1 Tax=Nocardia vinacea TaxID=96468 RepID=A0ABZ1YND1_9NOCA|nr:SDR family oxidoreductase [Nocardia vinacea]
MDSRQHKIVVVGAGSGIGAATAAHFHHNGDHVLAADLRPTKAQAAQHEQCDLRDATAIAALLDRIGPGWDLPAYIAGVPGTAPAADVLKVNYLGRHATVDDIVPVIAFLGSPQARWINGQDIHVDGGFVAPLVAGAPIQL